MFIPVICLKTATIISGLVLDVFLCSILCRVVTSKTSVSIFKSLVGKHLSLSVDIHRDGARNFVIYVHFITPP